VKLSAVKDIGKTQLKMYVKFALFLVNLAKMEKNWNVKLAIKII